MAKKIGITTIILIIILFAWQFDLIKYAYGQAQGQFHILWNAQPIDFYLQNPEYPDSMKQKILLSQEIKNFAHYELGLAGEKNYKQMYDQQGKPVLWVVTAAPVFKLEPYKWKFPILGTFSYKGFFNYEWAEKEAEKLKKQTLDVNIGNVNAWSTLGWFRDPLLSGMVLRSEGNLADLMIHELTHTTIYIKSDVDLNENLATFIGQKGAEMFLIKKYGINSPQYESYISSREDRQLFARHVLRGADYLDSIYGQMDESEPFERKIKIKKAAIAKFLASLDTVNFNDKARYTSYFHNFVPDNTFFLSFARYRAKLDNLESLFRGQFNGDLRAFIQYYKENYKSLQPPGL